MNGSINSLFPGHYFARAHPCDPYPFKAMLTGPIRASEMREDGPYVGVNFDVTNWGCLEQETKLHPLMQVLSRRSRTIDSSGTNLNEKTSTIFPNSVLSLL